MDSLLKNAFRMFVLTVLLHMWTSASATVINYSVTNFTGNSWRYDYGIKNNTDKIISEVTIYFNFDYYTNLSVTSSLPGWDAIVIQPDLDLPSDGLFDALALSIGLVPNMELPIASFSVIFDYIGASAAPGAQPFQTYDAEFELIDSGVTGDAAVPVPEPSIWYLFFAAGVPLIYRVRNSKFIKHKQRTFIGDSNRLDDRLGGTAKGASL